jgi:hypothetical protein
MKKLYFLLIPVILSCMFSCTKNNNPGDGNTQQAMIVGKWTMQKQIITQYVDGVKQSDSTLTVSNKVISYVQFDKNGSFTSASQYNSEGIGSTSLSAVIGVDSISGNYSFSGTVFNLSAAALGALAHLL